MVVLAIILAIFALIFWVLAWAFHLDNFRIHVNHSLGLKHNSSVVNALRKIEELNHGTHSSLYQSHHDPTESQ